jgi:hypothetical protein
VVTMVGGDGDKKKKQTNGTVGGSCRSL